MIPVLTTMSSIMIPVLTTMSSIIIPVLTTISNMALCISFFLKSFHRRKMAVFWDVALCSLVDDGNSTLF
jgi:hypothetical protein